jgi:enoyl-[acyl-carrier protein] reductase III
MKKTALILGASSGIGLATAKILAKNNWNIVIVHRDRRANLPAIENHFEEIREYGATLLAINNNACDTKGQEDIIAEIKKHSKDFSSIQALIHSIADGNIGSFTLDTERKTDGEGILRTINSMGSSFVVWTQLLIKNNLLSDNGRVLGFTSEGSQKVLNQYGAVGMAKATLEAACRYLAIELAPRGITVNLLSPGVIETPAIKVFPSIAEFVKKAKVRNPSGRLTTPEDVAKVAEFMLSENAAWITGEIIRVDGGEQIIGL